jgi:hypothetical protein
MNKLEIFQEVYGKDYVFTETELSRLLRIAELIVRECAKQCLSDDSMRILNHMGVKGEES